jgi:transposase, mutator family
MKLTTAQRSEIVSEPASSEAGFNELVRILLNRFSKQERALFLDEHKGEQGNGSVLVVGVDTVAAFNFAPPVPAWVIFNRSYSASWLLRKESVRCFFMSCMLMDFPVKTSGGLSPLTILKFFLRFIRHFESSVVRRYYSRWRMLHKKRHPDAEAPRCRECDCLMKRDGD